MGAKTKEGSMGNILDVLLVTLPELIDDLAKSMLGPAGEVPGRRNRERSLVKTKMEEALMWAKQAKELEQD